MAATKDNLTLHGALVCFFHRGHRRMNQQLKTILQITSVKIYELLSKKKDEPNFKDLIDAFARNLALYPEGKWDEAISHRQCILKDITI